MLTALPATAEQRFSVLLGGHQIGTLTYSGTQADARLRSQFNDTPLGVFDGSFEGKSRTGASGVIYRGKSASAKKSREVEIRSDKAGRVTDVSITPQKDITALSTPASVPVGVLDPVAGFGRLIAQNTCPAGFRLYDGRRVIEVTPRKSTTSDAVTTCLMDYRVVDGKGHLSPLNIKSITIKMVFDPTIAGQGPSQLFLRSGVFEVEFRRD